MSVCSGAFTHVCATPTRAEERRVSKKKIRGELGAGGEQPLTKGTACVCVSDGARGIAKPREQREIIIGAGQAELPLWRS